MPALILALLLAALVAPGTLAQEAPARSSVVAADALPHPTLDEIFRPPTLLGRRPAGIALSGDGTWVLWRHGVEDDDDSSEDDDDASEDGGSSGDDDDSGTGDGANDDDGSDDDSSSDDDDSSSDDDSDEPLVEAVWVARTDGSGEPRRLAEDASEVSFRWAATGARLLRERDGWLDLVDPSGEAPDRPLFEAQDGLTRVVPLEDGRRVVLQEGASHRLWVLDLEAGTRLAPADELDQRGAWFQVLEDAGLIALWAEAPEDPGSAGEDAPDDADAPQDTDDAAHDAHDAHGSTAAHDATDATATDEPDLRLWLVTLDASAPPRATRTEPGPGRLDLSSDGAWALRRDEHYEWDRELIMADYLTDDVTTVEVRSSMAGDDAPVVDLALVEIETGETAPLPLDGADSFYLRRASWSPADHRLLVERLSNDTHVRQILVVDPERSEARLIHAERDDAWVGGPLLFSDWTHDGTRVLFTSELRGWNRLYTLPVDDDGPLRCLTNGLVEVRQVFTRKHDSRVLVRLSLPLDRASWRLLHVDTDSFESLVVSPPETVASSVRVSRDGNTVAFLMERLGVPGDLYTAPLPFALADGVTAHDPVRLSDTVPAALTELDLPAPELVSYQNPDDDTTVHAYLYKPQPFDPEARYPAVMFIHGAGYLQNVQKSMSNYEVNMLFHHRLARQGFVVIDPDYRHSAGYGRDFRTDIHGFMGGKDLDDAVAGVDYLGTLGYVDTDRVGIYGGSYGGFMALMALFTQPEVFACGAALRSVTDWRVYNHWYTNPRLGDPLEDAENYARSSPIDHVEGMTKPLLLLHGLKDSNVFAQDSIRLMEALIEHEKDFEAMLYPSQGHAFKDPESWIDEYGRIERFFQRHLKGE